MKRDQFRHFDRLRVRWAEVDLQKIVFNAHYLTYFDTAVAGYWRALALPYHATMEHLGGDLFVRKATLEYLASARYDDVLDVGIRCGRIGNSSLVFHAAAFRGDAPLVGAELVYVFAEPATQTAQPVPSDLRTLLHGFEAGEPMIELRVGGWDELGRDAQRIRSSVFIDEQRIPAELEWDAADAGCVHAVAFNRFGVALATGLADVAAAVVALLLSAEVLLHAQTSAAGFYARAGFTARGAPFDEVGIAHVEMVRAL